MKNFPACDILFIVILGVTLVVRDHVSVPADLAAVSHFMLPFVAYWIGKWFRSLELGETTALMKFPEFKKFPAYDLIFVLILGVTLIGFNHVAIPAGLASALPFFFPMAAYTIGKWFRSMEIRESAAKA